MKEFLHCHRNDIGNSEHIKYLSKKLHFGEARMINETPRAQKRVREPSPIISFSATQQAEAKNKSVSTSVSEQDSQQPKPCYLRSYLRS